MILVTGATGTIGSRVARLLRERGIAHRGMSRTAGPGLMRGDYTDPASLDAALTDVDAVFLVTVPPVPSPAHDVVLVERALAAGVSRIVKLSAIGTGDSHDGRVVGAWHLAGEEAVAASGMAWTFLRPPSFASNFLAYRPSIAAGDPLPNMSGAARQPVVDPDDVAAVAVAALLDPVHGGRTYELTGPELLDFDEQAAIVARVVGREIRTVAVDPARHLRRSGVPAEAVSAITLGIDWAATGRAGVTDVVERVLARPAGSFERWVRAHADMFAVPERGPLP